MAATLQTLGRLLPSPVLKLSPLLHAAALGMAAEGRLLPWAVGSLVLNHLLLCFGGLWPRSRLLGPNHTRLPGRPCGREVALTIDDGPDPEVTPGVLDLLALHGARATFFCIGERVARHPQLALRIVREGHEIGNHSQHHHSLFSLFGPWRIAREIAQAQEAISRVCGVRPRWFRAPAGLRNPFLQPQLAQLDLALASWTRRGFDTVRADPARVLRALVRRLAPGDILLLHDGQAARSARGTPVILEVLPELLQELSRRNLRSVTLSEGDTMEYLSVEPARA